MEFVIGSYLLFCGHTWVTRGNEHYYALRSLADASSLLVYDACAVGSNEGNLILPQQELPSCGELGTSGRHSCHITILPAQAVVADYTSGTLSLFELDAQGIPKGDASVLKFPVRDASSDPAINKERQSTPHIHSSWVSPDGRHLVVVDLGSDRLYCFDIVGGHISNSWKEFNLPAGCGPRHCAFGRSADGSEHLYVATELSDEVLVYSWPDMTLEQRCLANDARPGGGGHIAISLDGKHLYMSCRLENDGLAIFSIAADGSLRREGYQNTGVHPRHFSISQDGEYVTVACRDSDLIQVFERNAASGLLSICSEFQTPKPVFVDFKNKLK